MRKTKVDVGRLRPSPHRLAVSEEVKIYLEPKLDGQIEKAEGCHGFILRRWLAADVLGLLRREIRWFIAAPRASEDVQEVGVVW